MVIPPVRCEKGRDEGRQGPERDGFAMPRALIRQRELYARAKRLMRDGYTTTEAARKVGRSRDWLMKLLAQERREFGKVA